MLLAWISIIAVNPISANACAASKPCIVLCVGHNSLVSWARFTDLVTSGLASDLDCALSLV